MDLERFREICINRCGLDPAKVVLAAFSGGADSLSLVVLLHRAGFSVVAAHFNHHLRTGADQDELEAGLIARKLGIPFMSGGGDVPEYIRENHLSVEEGARQLRYRWLLDTAKMKGAQALAVGHTADDQVETVLMHLLRGAGMDGLAGMPDRQTLPIWGTDIPVVRPLLSYWRDETESLCKESGLVPLQDDSNASTIYFRNRIRHELIPFLRTYNAKVKNHILQTASILAEEQTILSDVKNKAWDTCFIEQRDSYICLDLDCILSQQEGLRRAVLRQAIAILSPGIRDVDFQLTARMSEFVQNPTRSGEMSLTANLWIQRTNDRVSLWNGKPGLIISHPQLESGDIVKIPEPGIYSLRGWELDIVEDDLQSAWNSIRSGKHTNRVWLDYEKLQFPLEVRGGIAGERLHPFGLKGKSQKLSDYYTNHKVPRQARGNWPLVISGDNVVWVVGLGIGEGAAITPKTKRVLRFSLRFPALPPNG